MSALDYSRTNALSVIAFSDEPVAHLGLKTVLEADPGFALKSSCSTAAELTSAIAASNPDLIVYGCLRDTDLSHLPEFARIAPRASIVLWSRSFSADVANQAIALGVRGFLSTTAKPETLLECLHCAAGGETWMERSLSTALINARPVSLSRRQNQLLELLVQGLKNKEIATALGISEGTVKAYLTTLFEKVGAKDRFELAVFGWKYLRYASSTADRPESSGKPVPTYPTPRSGRRILV